MGEEIEEKYLRVTCPICGVILYFRGQMPYGQCRTCLRMYDLWNERILWWPNDQGVEPPQFLLDLGFVSSLEVK